jgi:pyridoxamine 5'-phosphate oxidase
VRWLDAAKQVSGFSATAMSLATVAEDGSPDVRIVLLQSVRDGGLVFFTNLESPKGRHMLATRRAAACFHWPALGRQVRLRGTVGLVEPDHADAYFASRPRGSQIGAHASPQSATIAGREDLIGRVAEACRRFAGEPVPRPENWSGFLLVPREVEFWEDGKDRLHDRLLFTRRKGTLSWSDRRLAP